MGYVDVERLSLAYRTEYIQIRHAWIPGVQIKELIQNNLLIPQHEAQHPER